MKADPMKNSQPNILYVCTDQQSIRAMGAYGNKHVRTPNMDALAAGGVRFNNCKRSANFINLQLSQEPKYRLGGYDKHDANIQ